MEEEKEEEDVGRDTELKMKEDNEWIRKRREMKKRKTMVRRRMEEEKEE